MVELKAEKIFLSSLVESIGYPNISHETSRMLKFINISKLMLMSDSENFSYF